MVQAGKRLAPLFLSFSVLPLPASVCSRLAGLASYSDIWTSNREKIPKRGLREANKELSEICTKRTETHTFPLFLLRSLKIGSVKPVLMAQARLL